jgi:hypothetical protein
LFAGSVDELVQAFSFRVGQLAPRAEVNEWPPVRLGCNVLVSRSIRERIRLNDRVEEMVDPLKLDPLQREYRDEPEGNC